MGQVGHNWVAERSKRYAPLGAPRVDMLRWEKGWSALLPPPKALGPTASRLGEAET